jgi:hypothetical protein
MVRRPRRRLNKVIGVGDGVGVFVFMLAWSFLIVLLFVL